MAAQQDVLDIFLAILSGYPLTHDDKIHAVRALRSVVHGFVDLEIMGGFRMALNQEESFRRLMQTFIAGLHLFYPGSQGT